MVKNKKNDLVIREKELSRIVRFFDTDGGALLIGGDRGSGKTTLLRASIDRLMELQLARKKHIFKIFVWLRRLTKSPFIIVNIPLIIISPNKADDNYEQNLR